MVSPLAEEHIHSLKHTSDTFDVTMALLSRAADGMTPLVPDGAPALDLTLVGTLKTSRSPRALGRSVWTEQSKC